MSNSLEEITEEHNLAESLNQKFLKDLEKFGIGNTEPTSKNL